jgi:cysteine desulfurase
MIYLDHNATTPIDERVKNEMAKAFSFYGNPSSIHAAGREAKAAVENARQKVAELIGCEASEIIFTSGGTESNNLAIIGTAYKYQKGHIITSAIEHPAVLNTVRWLENKGFEATYLPVDSNGMVSAGDLKKALRKDTILITIMHSNNETGVLQPVPEIGKIARQYNIPFHSDAAQSVGKMEVNVSSLNADMLTVVSHKFYGPKGAGALYIKNGIRILPVMFGAGHEGGLRPGTENVIGIAGLGKACEITAKDMPARYENAVKLRDMFFSLIKEKAEVSLNGHKTMRLPNTSNISIKGIVAEDIVFKLKDKVALSSGSACHAGVRKPSSVLKAMGLSDDDAMSSLRISVGKDNTVEEIKEAVNLLASCVKSLAE